MNFGAFKTDGDVFQTQPLAMWLLYLGVLTIDWLVSNPWRDYRDWRDRRRIAKDLHRTRQKHHS